MTLRENEKDMLSIKFPDYTYVKNTFLHDFVITDADEVKVWVGEDYMVGEGDDAHPVFDGYEGKITGVDLSKLVLGMKIDALIKDYKKEQTMIWKCYLKQDFVLVQKIIQDIWH